MDLLDQALAAVSLDEAISGDVKLRPHQMSAVAHLGKNGGSGIVAHGTGSGKTLTGIAVAETLRETMPNGRVLIFCPSGLRNQLVVKGVKRFTNATVKIIRSKHERRVPFSVTLDAPGKADYYVMSYGLLNHTDTEEIYYKLRPTIILADEIHQARNVNTKLYKRLMKLRSRVNHFVGLTASIISNSPNDIVALTNLVKGKEGLSKQAFSKKFVGKEDVKRGYIVKRTIGQRKFLKNKSSFDKEVKRHVHYVGKEDLPPGGYPKVDSEVVQVPMNRQQMRVYRFAENKLDPITKMMIRRGLPVDHKEAATIFGKIIRARQASNGVHLFDRRHTPESASEVTPKIKKLLDDVESHVKSTKDAKVIIYTHLLNSGVDVITAGLKKRGLDFVSLTGQHSQKEKNSASHEFGKGAAKIIVLSPAGEVGFDFPNTTFVAVADGHFNPEKVRQAEARGVRMGGQQHRHPDDRKVEIKYYHSVYPPIPKAFEKAKKALFGHGQPLTVDQWIHKVAADKEQWNDEFKQALKGR